MCAYLGSWKVDDALTFYANTHNPFTGSATDADALPTYRIYEDEASSAIYSGTMALLDGANTTGLYSEQITLNAANGIEKGKQYVIYKFAIVGGSPGATHDTFQIEAEVDANSVSATVTVGTNNDKTGYRLSSTGVDDILDEVVEGTRTFRQYLRGMASALLAKLSGAATTTVTIRDVDDSKDRVTATVDADGNRTAVTLDLT